MKWKLILWISLLSGLINVINAQPKNDLSGEFIGNSKYLNNNFIFFENGKMLVNKEFPAEYYYENDSLFIFRNMEIAVYKLEKNKLVGLSKWEKNQTLKSKKSSLISINQIDLSNPRAEWLKRFYKNNVQREISIFSNDQQSIKDLILRNEENIKLCQEGFDLGCIQNFSFLTHQLMNRNQNEENYKVDFETLKLIAQQVIELGNSDGYGLMYSYFVMNDQENMGEKYLELGLELGSQLCLKLSMDKLIIGD
ncbi:hypothetical protein [Faecalibacter rhinopitheci]|uniref:Sel1 repeat family protein n=1 Tax=Faecalibacter rhinopitheci TaxID=2779678 RepID=A0A8J7FST4_9FLAO|nr:hypothetical protein [Faecalibacter rhinopitheci]MBF0598258.1 hypothetical protein [Faecalibacter rhinopitheci]MBQ0148027.1 hypothetical protein [Candidatus Onthonaster equi]